MPESHVVRSVYVHIPFCRRRCPYCDYAVAELEEGGVSPWLEAIRGEWKAVTGAGGPQIGRLETLYVGGGTPSALGAEAMRGLRSLFGERLLASPGLEWTAEANPEDLTPELAAAWRESGVNRVSLGIQSLQDDALRWLGRIHSAEEAYRALDAALGAGIANVNVDLALGLPEGVGHDWQAELDRVAALRPAHVTLQEISVEPGTPLAADVEAGKERMPEPEASRDAYRRASRVLRAAGYHHYEVSSFALPGRESRHGLAYLSGRPYVGLGNGAHSYLPPRRRWNLADWGGYCTAARDDTLSRHSTVEGEEELSVQQARLEGLWLGLRARSGVPRDRLPPEAARLVARWIREGYAEDDPEVVRLTGEGWLRLDHLVVELERCLPASPSDSRPISIRTRKRQ
ncbi:MAG: radical SAM family heme chaperone HemW [Gemmatimonadota bacterium]